MSCDLTSFFKRVVRVHTRQGAFARLQRNWPTGRSAGLRASLPFNNMGGFSLPVAVFILVIMALLGTALVSLLQSSRTALGQEAVSTRAFYAAESGAQIALAQLFSLSGAPANCAASYPTTTFTASGLDGCNALVTCSSTTLGSSTYYTLTSTGSCSFANTSATRQIELMAKSP
ncbi:MAG: hypothetical protein HY080_14445 [Gammaproteobacteria bacterium]|nr:hypothetical protein [Gammaproteobacteria bacterium]